MGWDFKKKSTAETLARMAEERLARETGRLRNYIKGHVGQAILVKTPQDGIPARQEIDSDSTDRDEYNLGTAECTLLSTYDGQTPDIERSQQYTRSVRRPDSTTLTAADGTDSSTGQPFDWRDGKKADGPDLGEVKVWVSNPYVSAIAGNKIILAHYIDGSYVVAEPPAGTRIRFALKTDLVDGSATAYILDPPPAQGQDYAEVTVYDTRKAFVGAAGAEGTSQVDRTSCIPADGSAGDGTATGFWGKNGSIGWANYSSSIGPSGGAGGYEIESCTLPADRWYAITEPTAPEYGGANQLKGVDAEWSSSPRLVFTKAQHQRSTYPAVDFPPEFQCLTVSNSSLNSQAMEYQLQVYNPNKFSIMPGVGIEIERMTVNGVATEYDSIEYPLVHPLYQTGISPSYRWVVTGCEMEVAKWVQVVSVDGQSPGTCAWEYDEVFKDGGDPKVYFQVGDTPALKTDIPVVAAPGIEKCCADGSTKQIPKAGSKGWAWWDRQSQEYVVVVTQSAMLGDPTGEDYLLDVAENGAGGGSCGLGITKTKGLFGWQCTQTTEDISLSIPQKEIKYISGLSGGCNVICPTFEYATVLDCGTNTGGYVSCMNIYADPCATCTGTCNWYWNGTDWEEDPVTPHDCTSTNPDCGCEGQEPPPYESGPTTVTTSCAVDNSPPEPPPCQTCTLCENRDIQIDDVEYTAGLLPPASYYTMVDGTSQRVGDCEWTVTVTWSEIGSADTNETATITFDGTTWTCSVPNSPQGTQGNWSYTPPDSPCSPGILQKLDDGVELVTSHPGQATVTFGASGPLC